MEAEKVCEERDRRVPTEEEEEEEEAAETFQGLHRKHLG